MNLKKLLSSYHKEMRIAARGFYFYIEIGTALILLIILLFGVKPYSTAVREEFILFDLPKEVQQMQEQRDREAGTLQIGEAREWSLQAESFRLTNRDTGEVTEYNFPEQKSITTRTLEQLDPISKRVVQRGYQVENLEDLYRLAYQERAIGAVITQAEDQKLHYRYLIQGYETDRLVDTLYILHNEDTESLRAAIEGQKVRTLGIVERLNNRENIIPIFLTFAGSLMGFFIVAAYIFLDKAEGVIKAFAVSPGGIRNYLLSKVLVVCTTVVLSSSIITIPIMGSGPNYPGLYLFLIISTSAFTVLGLLVASYFENIRASFGVLYGCMILLMIPSFSYLIPSFDPVWIRVLPTYPVLQTYKDLLLNSSDTSSLWIYSGLFLLGGVGLFELTHRRFKMSL